MCNPDRDSDVSTLIRRAKCGEAAALALLFERYREYLMYTAERALGPGLRRRCDPGDIVQEAYAAATRGFLAFEGGSEPEFSAWITTILRTQIAAALRHHKAQTRDWQRERELVEADGSATVTWFEPIAKDSSPSQRYICGENALKLLKVLRDLPEDQRLAVQMRYLDGEKLAEIAERMQRSPDAVAGLIRRGLTALRRLIGSETTP